MYQNLKILIFLCLFLQVPRLATAQFDVSYFELAQTGKSVKLNWQIKEGSTCNGIRILRSTDSITYTQIGEVQGICGSTSVAQSFEFTDENPIDNVINYYKLEFGLGEYWLIKQIAYTYVDAGLFELQNPAGVNTTIFFTNQTNLTVRLLGLNGTVLYQTSISQLVYTLGNLFPAYPQGMFFIEATDQKGHRQVTKIIGFR